MYTGYVRTAVYGFGERKTVWSRDGGELRTRTDLHITDGYFTYNLRLMWTDTGCTLNRTLPFTTISAKNPIDDAGTGGLQ